MADLNEQAGTNPAGKNLFDVSKPIPDMTKKELQNEATHWRNMYTYLSDELKSFLGQLGQPVMIYKRDGGSFRGDYAGFKVEIIEHRFSTIERIRDDVAKQYFIMRNESSVPVTNIIDFKWIKDMYDDSPDPYMQQQEQKIEGEFTENSTND